MARTAKKSTQKVTYTHAWIALALTRIVLGFIFVWAFVDKLFGFGIATPAAKAWLSGGSPTTGFLTGAGKAGGPFADMFASLAGQAWVDWLFMLGLLGIGVALVLGIGLRIAAVGGTIMLVMMWMAALPLANNPLVDDHIIYALILWVIALGRRELSLTNWWLAQPFVAKNSWLW